MKQPQWSWRSFVRLHSHFFFLCFYRSCKWFPELFRFAKHAMILMKQTWTLTCDFILKSTTCVEVHRFLGFNVSFFPFLFLFFSFFFFGKGGGGGGWGVGDGSISTSVILLLFLYLLFISNSNKKGVCSSLFKFCYSYLALLPNVNESK